MQLLIAWRQLPSQCIQIIVARAGGPERTCDASACDASLLLTASRTRKLVCAQLSLDRVSLCTLILILEHGQAVLCTPANCRTISHRL